MAYQFTGKAAIVTGASSGIGRVVAMDLAHRGVKVALLARRLDLLEQTRADITKAGGSAIAVQCDVANSQSVEQAVREAGEKLGPVNLLVLSAGIYVRGNAQDLRMDSIRRSMDVNFYGSLHVLYSVLSGMLERESGDIAVITSVDGRKAFPLDAAYSASKFALTGFLESMRQDLRGTGVNILNVLPGRVDTPMVAHLDVPAASPKIPPQRVSNALIAGLRHRRKEVIVPWLSASTLILANTLSPSLGDWFVRVLKLAGKQKQTV